MSAEREVHDWLCSIEFESNEDECMRTLAIRVLAEHVQYDEDEEDSENVIGPGDLFC